MRRRRAAMWAVIAVGLATVVPGWSPARDEPHKVVTLHWPGEIHVNAIDGECIQTLVIPSLSERGIMERFNIAYRRAEGCRWATYDRELAGLKATLAVLFEDLPDRNRLTGFFFGRVTQPELRLRIANAGLKHDLTTAADTSGYYRQLRGALDAEEVFRELKAIMQEHGFTLRLRTLEKIERVREVGLGELAVSRQDLVLPPPENALLPVAAIVWFDLSMR